MRWIATVGLVLALAACGTNDVVVGAPRPGDANRALAEWDDFPRDAERRPIVLTYWSIGQTEAWRTDAEQGFFWTGKWKVPEKLPTGPRTRDGFPLIDAAEALKRLREDVSGNQGDTPGAAVEIVKVRLGSSKFSTDRGTRTLPAWFVHFKGYEDDPSVILAVTGPERYSFRTFDADWYPLDTVVVRDDDRTLDVHFTGGRSGTGPCDEEYRIVTTESDRAVAVRIEKLPNTAVLQEGEGCHDLGYGRELAAPLEAPLDDRVVVWEQSNEPQDVLTVAEDEQQRRALARQRHE